VLEFGDTYFVLDASGTRVFCGIHQGDRWEASFYSDAEALEAIFSGAEAVGFRDYFERGRLAGLICCNGPGSILGIRLALMACAGWRSLPGLRAAPVLSYQSLHAAAALLLEAGTAAPDLFSVISEFRKGRWNRLDVRAGVPIGPIYLDNLESIGALSHPVFSLRQRHRAAPPPANARAMEYDPGIDGRWLHRIPLQRWERAPEVYVAEEPTFVKWTPDRHR